MMAAAQMQSRQYQQMYTPQSNSPASAVSSQGPEQPNRMYSQPHQMYYPSYSMNQMTSNSYAQHANQPPPAQHQMMTPPQSAISHHQGQPPMSHPPSSAHISAIANSPRSQPNFEKFDPALPRPLETANLQRPAVGQVTSHHNTPTSASQNGGGAGGSQAGSAAGNQNAAPGPIPATTPLVVRQDNNGVQWIAFEYSRDRVKMEYTIRCDVESVNIDNLSKEFKEANCVYPRAFCEKGKYQGNRLNYETECNQVGWSLVELNSVLKEKRGLIQRAVDSWRNSNQDSRLRSRRVRRINKQGVRSKNQNTTSAAGPRDASAPSNAMLQQRPLPPSMSPATAAQMHHPHATADGTISAATDSLSLSGPYDHRQTSSKPHHDVPHQIRPANVFQGYPNYPLQPVPGNVSVPPPVQNGMESHMPSHSTHSITASSTRTRSIPPPLAARSNTSSPLVVSNDLSELYPHVPGKKFINVADPGNTPPRVRVKLDLRDVDMVEVPDDFRERNSVYPRSYFPQQMGLTSQEKRQKRSEGRFSETDDDSSNATSYGVGSTLVKIPTVDGDTTVHLPRLGKRVGEDEERLNDLGYRISWDQRAKFSARTTFLQRSRE